MNAADMQAMIEAAREDGHEPAITACAEAGADYASAAIWEIEDFRIAEFTLGETYYREAPAAADEAWLLQGLAGDGPDAGIEDEGRHRIAVLGIEAVPVPRPDSGPYRVLRISSYYGPRIGIGYLEGDDEYGEAIEYGTIEAAQAAIDEIESDPEPYRLAHNESGSPSLCVVDRRF